MYLGSEKDGMAVPYVPHPLDRLSPLSEMMTRLFLLICQYAVLKTPLNPFEHFFGAILSVSKAVPVELLPVPKVAHLSTYRLLPPP